MDRKLKIKDFAAFERPRERLRSQGPAALSNAELLAIMIDTGTSGETAVDLARRLLSLAPGGGPPKEDGAAEVALRYLATAPFEELSRVKGIGLAKAARIKAAVELGQRLAAAAGSRRTIRSPGDAASLLMENMRSLDKEHFKIILLNTKNHVLGVELISVGSLNSSIVHPREIFKSAIRRSAAAIILAHNHPSGDPSPSREDEEVTRRLREAGKILGIEVVDHVILGDNRYFSFREGGLDWTA